MSQPAVSELVISDEQFVADYVSFALWQPAYAAHWLYLQARDASSAKPCFALQMYLNMQMALEMVSKWYFTLRDWRPGAEPLLWKFKTTAIKEDSSHADFTTDVALHELSFVPVGELSLRLKQPPSDALRDRGWSEGELKERAELTPRLFDTLKVGLNNRNAASGDFRRAYNNIKHGLIFLQELPAQGYIKPQGAMFLVARAQKAADADSTAITPIGLGSEDQDLRPLRDTCIGVSRLVAVLVAILPWYHESKLPWREYNALPRNSITALTAVWKKLDELVAQS